MSQGACGSENSGQRPARRVGSTHRAPRLTSFSMSTPPLPSFSATRMVGLAASAATATTAEAAGGSEAQGQFGWCRRRQWALAGGQTQKPARRACDVCLTGTRCVLQQAKSRGLAHLPCWLGDRPLQGGMRAEQPLARPSPAEEIAQMVSGGASELPWQRALRRRTPTLMVRCQSPASSAEHQLPAAAHWQPPGCAAGRPPAAGPCGPVQAAWCVWGRGLPASN